MSARFSADSPAGWYYRVLRASPTSSHWRAIVRSWCSRSMHRLNPSAELGSFFFEPLDFHLQPAYLLEEFLIARPVLGCSFTASVLKQRRKRAPEDGRSK